MSQLVDLAVGYRDAGLCVLPAQLNPKKPIVPTWKPYQEHLPSDAELRKWFRKDKPMCILTGKASGNLEVIDFDCQGTMYEPWRELVEMQAPGLLDRLVVEQSMSGGFHVLYRCDVVSRSMKLAERIVVVEDEDPVVYMGKEYKPCFVKDHWQIRPVLIETRGEGGLFVCSPTPGYALIHGDFANIPIVAEAEREAILQAAWSLNEIVPEGEPDYVRCASVQGGRPGDDFNERGDVREVLVKHGWVRVREGDNEYWRRPGKNDGWSATLRQGVFFVHSSNAYPFEPQTWHRPFGVFALLEHNGDFPAAASALRQLGYGNDNEPTDVDLSGLTSKVAAQPASSQLVVRQLNDVERQALAWLWPGRIPLGKLTLLGGDPGLGKSIVTLDLAARVSTGSAWPDCPLLPQQVGRVILFNAEDDLADTIAPRLDRAGADDSMIMAVEGVEGPRQGKTIRWYFSLENDLPRLEALLAANPDVRLVVIDPISAYCGKVDSHNNAEVRSLLAPLAELAARYHVAIVCVTHLSKSGGTKAIYRAMGSLAFAAAARAVWAVTKDADDPQRRLFLPAKLNLATDPDGLAYRIVKGRVEWEPEPVKMHADDAFAAEVAAMQSRGRSQAKNEAADWLKNKLAAGPLPAGDVIEEGEQYGMSKRTLRRALQEIGGKTQKAEFGSGWVWSLSDVLFQGAHEGATNCLPL